MSKPSPLPDAVAAGLDVVSLTVTLRAVLALVTIVSQSLTMRLNELDNIQNGADTSWKARKVRSGARSAHAARGCAELRAIHSDEVGAVGETGAKRDFGYRLVRALQQPTGIAQPRD